MRSKQGGLFLVVLAAGWWLAAAGCVLPPSSSDDDDLDDDATGDDDTDDDDDADDDATDDDDDSITPPANWVGIQGGSFWMGSDEGPEDESPRHEVDIPDFDIWRTEVTASQYMLCYQAGACGEPDSGGACDTWGESDLENHPINQVTWDHAVQFCSWVGGRLPSEAEWEFAARSGGQDITYPWGDMTVSCDYAVMQEEVDGCGDGCPWEVCSMPDGNTQQGLCDMMGNVSEWVQDWYHVSYDYGDGAPADGSAWEDPQGTVRVRRGGGYKSQEADIYATRRNTGDPSATHSDLGIRCARAPVR